MNEQSQGAATPSVVAPPPGHPRFPHYDSLRGLAALMVLTIHCLIAANAEGVPLSQVVNHFEVSITILFMLSAFLLYRPFVAARLGKAPAVAIRDYAFRRVLRIVPGYYAALIVLSIYPGLKGGVLGTDWWVYFGFMQSYQPIYDIDYAVCGVPPFCGIAPAWTLVVEVSFYALLPLFVLFMGWIAARARHPFRFELGVLAVLGGASALARLLAFENLPADAWVLQTLPTVFLWLAAGMALAAVSAQLQSQEANSRTVMLITHRPWLPWLCAFAIYGALIFGLEPTPDVLGHSPAASIVKFVALTVIALLLLLPATFGIEAGGWPRRVLANRLIAWLGLIAYGVYLYHLPVMYQLVDLGVGDIDAPFLRWVVLTVVTLGVSIACGAASYYLLERRFLRLKYRRTRRASPDVPVGEPARSHS